MYVSLNNNHNFSSVSTHSTVSRQEVHSEVRAVNFETTSHFATNKVFQKQSSSSFASSSFASSNFTSTRNFHKQISYNQMNALDYDDLVECEK
jgi:uncharacterized membrane protein YcgQ (UPF0703/DUF1980 family)